MKRILRVFAGVLSALFSTTMLANVSVPAVFANHMVLQQQSNVKLWGWGKPQEKVTVTVGWNTDTLKAEVDNQGHWLVELQTPKAGGPYEIKMQGYNTVILHDIMIGEVWLLSGQSNMEWTTRGGIIGKEEAVKQADLPNVRLFTVTPRTALNPTHDVSGEWNVCTPETMLDFSSVGYFFGKKLQENLDVPIGLICSSWGGTPIEVWMSEDVINSDPQLLKSAQSLDPVPWGPVEPGRAYNAMIAPMIPFNFAGVLWYQGEANTANPSTYTEMLQTLIKSWRKDFDKDLPFYFAQIAPWKDYGGTTGVEIRNAQRRALSLDNTGMVVTSDIGDTLDIHPKNKKDVGLRFANMALNKTYGKTDLPIYGPLFSSYEVKGGKVTVLFDYADGLKVKGNALSQFEIKDEEGNWHSAKAKVRKNAIVLSSKVKLPQAVRFAWSNAATPGLFNQDGLPASCFNTDLAK
nr:sialate O-acetylesterase [uncultured Carboxylicivirga sp.]